jgi:hypothetical protein
MSINIRTKVYDFMEYMINDSSGKIWETFMDHENAVNLLLQRNSHAIMYYNMYNVYFENKKKFLKKENLPCYRWIKFDNIDSLIRTSIDHSNIRNENMIFTFCKFLWLYMHH